MLCDEEELVAKPIRKFRSAMLSPSSGVVVVPLGTYNILIKEFARVICKKHVVTALLTRPPHASLLVELYQQISRQQRY